MTSIRTIAVQVSQEILLSAALVTWAAMTVAVAASLRPARKCSK
jgi:hypothetical protein